MTIYRQQLGGTGYEFDGLVDLLGKAPRAARAMNSRAARPPRTPNAPRHSSPSPTSR